MSNIDLSANPKQAEYFYSVMSAISGTSACRYFAYGGAIRGGKTYVTLAILVLLAAKYKKSRWHVIRQDMPVLESTTIPSFEKLIEGSRNWRMVRDKSNYRAVHTNGSIIFFKGENYQRDPDLKDFLGLETNGIFLEQGEELSEKIWDKALERTGSWYIDPMPPGLIFLTFNPTQNWVKQKFYEPWRKMELKEPYFFQPAFPKDNPFVTDGQWSQWGNMAERYRLQFIEGDWTDFGAGGLWAFAFNRSKHVGLPELDKGHIVYLSFDFNKNPICCSVIQHIDNQIRVLETIKLGNSDIYALCQYIKAHYMGRMFLVTGDASGNSGSALVQDNSNYYTVIKSQLNLPVSQMYQPSVNPRLADNQLLVNSLLATYDIVIHEKKAEGLIYDMGNVKMLPDGTIKKTDRNDPAQQADALDTFRYYCNIFHLNYLK